MRPTAWRPRDDRVGRTETTPRAVPVTHQFLAKPCQPDGLELVVDRALRLQGLLSEVRTRAPDTVRMLLTGHSDIESAVAAINHGAIFRFLCKPCPSDVLVSSLEMAADHHRLVRAERELLEDTLKGTIDVLSQVLGLVSPAAFSRAAQVEAYVAHMARALEVEDPWVYRVAARLSQLGCVAVPGAAMIRLAIAVDRDVARGKTLDQAVILARRNKAHHPRLLEAIAAFSGREQCARSSSTS